MANRNDISALLGMKPATGRNDVGPMMAALNPSPVTGSPVADTSGQITNTKTLLIGGGIDATTGRERLRAASGTATYLGL